MYRSPAYYAIILLDIFRAFTLGFLLQLFLINQRMVSIQLSHLTHSSLLHHSYNNYCLTSSCPWHFFSKFDLVTYKSIQRCMQHETLMSLHWALPVCQHAFIWTRIRLHMATHIIIIQMSKKCWVVILKRYWVTTICKCLRLETVATYHSVSEFVRKCVPSSLNPD